MQKITARLLVALFLLMPFAVFSGLPQTDSLAQKKIEPIDPIDINFEIERLEKEYQKMDVSLVMDKRVIQIDSLFHVYKNFLTQEADEFNSYNPYNLSKYFLENSYRMWEGFTKKLTGWQAEISGKLSVLRQHTQALEKIQKTWELTLQSDNMKNEPDALKTRIRSMISRAEDYQNDLTRMKWKYVSLEDEITDMITYCNNLVSRILQLQQNQRDSLFLAVARPIWDIRVDRSDVSPFGLKLKKVRHENIKILKNYFLTQSLERFWSIAILIIIFLLLMRRSYFKRGFDEDHSGHASIIKIFHDDFFITLLALVMVTFHLMYPYYPLVLNHILTLILLIIIRVILSKIIDQNGRRFILRLIILLLLNDLEIVFWYFGDVARYYLLLESVVAIFLMLPYLRPATFRKFFKTSMVKRVMLLLASFAIVFYLIGLVTNIFGFLDLSILVIKAGIHVPEFTVVLYGLYNITLALIRMLISVWSTGKNRLLDNYWESIEKNAIKIAGILTVLFWINSLFVTFEISRVFYDAISGFLWNTRKIGTMEMTIGSLFALILILMVTFLLTGIIKIFVEHYLIRRARLPRGVPAAISVTIRYFLVVLGFLFALSAAGIDLGKFSLLAGALGVGIGFGLQNIVNNFISGLILVYERPIQVGDTIEVENLLGQVNRIGIRSSNVKTYDGAEVIVPNSNLISNQLINWTLSDNQRRIEVKVGVSYGSDPNVVISLLEKVATDNEDVLKDPAPWALFEAFGDSSLNFRLLCWVPYEMGLRTKSALAVAIFNIFHENGIQIPFPQLDLHVKKEKDELTEEEIRDIEKPKKKKPSAPGKSSK